MFTTPVLQQLRQDSPTPHSHIMLCSQVDSLLLNSLKNIFQQQVEDNALYGGKWWFILTSELNNKP